MRFFMLLLTLALGVALACAQVAPGREVTQTVFDTTGKPAARVRVIASYCLGRSATFQRVTTDDNGIAIWKNLPAAPVIVWGERVPAGVIPADATVVTEPLPAPKPQEKVNVYFTSGGVAQDRQTTFLVWQGQTSIVRSSPRGRDNYYLTAGVSTTVSAVSLNPSGMATFGTVYLPYPAAKGGSVEFIFDIVPGPTLNGRFKLANGTPVGAVSKLGFLPEKSVGITPTELYAVQRVTGPNDTVTPLLFYPDGHFTVQFPAPGTYRLLLDLFDQSMPSIPALTMEIKPGAQDAVITLPDPLVTVPAGTQLFWMAKNAPMNPQCLLVPATQAKMPVFGPKDALLTLWYNPSPNTMMLITNTTGPRLLSKRQVRLTVLDDKGALFVGGMPMRHRISLLPPFPPQREIENNRWDALAYLRRLPEFARLRADDNPWQLTLWSGSYLVMASTEGLYGKPNLDKIKFIQPITVNADGPTEITVTDPVATQPKPTDPVDAPSPPLCTISGRLLNADGTPMANTRVFLQSAMTDRNKDPNLRRIIDKVIVNGITDADGRFTIANAPSGAVSLRVSATTDRWSSWQCVVPPTGVNELTLQALAKPLSFFIDSNASGTTLIWWVPYTGLPLRIPTSSQYAYTNTLPQNEGYFWMLDTLNGAGKCLYYAPGVPFESMSAPTINTSLGIYLPLDLTQGYPGAITLTGTNDRQGLRMVITQPVWNPVALLSQMVTQIDAVPPGNYTVTVETAKGPISKTTSVTSSGGCVQF